MRAKLKNIESIDDFICINTSLRELFLAELRDEEHGTTWFKSESSPLVPSTFSQPCLIPCPLPLH
jgi:hypothetical protein